MDWRLFWLGAASLVLAVYLLCLTVAVGRRFSPWVLGAILLIDAILVGPLFLIPVLWVLKTAAEAGEGLGLPFGSWFNSLTESRAGVLAPPIVFFAWKLWLLRGLVRWEPVRGMFRRPPRWPAPPPMRGRRRPRRREFKEPMPWTRGPSSW